MCMPGLLMLKNSQARFCEQKLGCDGTSPTLHEEAGRWVSLVEGFFARKGLPCPTGSLCKGYSQPALTLSLVFPALFASCVRAPAARPVVSHSWDSSALKWFLLFFFLPLLPRC